MEIVYNLIYNAVKHNKNGGNITTSLRFDKDTKKLVTSIEDTGQGIPDEIKPNLFKTFRRQQKQPSSSNKSNN